MNDVDIKNLLLDTSQRLKHNWNKILNNNKDHLLYIKNRFIDSESLVESIYRIIKDINPACEICGKHTKFCYPKGGRYFLSYCSNECKKIGMNRKTNKNEISEKIKNSWNIKTLEEKSHIRNKIKNTCIEKYGIGISINPVQNKKTMMIKYGVENPSQFKNRNINWDIAVKKQYNTKKKNNSFNVSKQEELSYKILKEKFSDIIRQYNSKLYPFACDFYIPSLDLYIEYNGTWTHGGHPYSKDNKEDISIVEKWKSKNTSYYDNAIKVWTYKDPLKRMIAKENKINYKEFWNINEIKYWIDSLKI